MNNNNTTTTTTIKTTIKRARDWCFTSYNLDNYELFKTINDAIFVKYQVEICPDTERKHIQGFIQFKDGKTMSAIKKILKDDTIHLEQRRGTVKSAMEYCGKDDTRDVDYERVEYGNVRGLSQGKRTDIEEMYELIKHGATIEDLKEFSINTYTKYYRAFEKLWNDEQSKSCGKFKDIEVNILTGESGTGKTSYIMEKYGSENVYSLEQSNGDTVWFNGYSGQKILLIDDFYGWIKYSYMLRLLDGYKMRLEVKGGFTYSNWDKIYITSNARCEEWYKNGLGALHRRINNIYNVPEYGRMIRENKKYKLCKKTIEIRNWTIEDDDENYEVDSDSTGDCTEVASNTMATISASNVTPDQLARVLIDEKVRVEFKLNGIRYLVVREEKATNFMDRCRLYKEGSDKMLDCWFD